MERLRSSRDGVAWARMRGGKHLKRGFPPAWNRGEDALGCAGSVRALGGGGRTNIEGRGQHPDPPVSRRVTLLGQPWLVARQAWRDSGTEKLCPISKWGWLGHHIIYFILFMVPSRLQGAASMLGIKKGSRSTFAFAVALLAAAS